MRSSLARSGPALTVHVDAISPREAREAVRGAFQIAHEGSLVRCFHQVELADGARTWKPLRAVWINPAMGLATAYLAAAYPTLLRGAFAIELAGAAGRAALGGWFGRWRGEQIAAGAVKWGGSMGVATAPPGSRIALELEDGDEPSPAELSELFTEEVTPADQSTPPKALTYIPGSQAAGSVSAIAATPPPPFDRGACW